MIEVNGKHLCENCFEEKDPSAVFCTRCGYNPNVVMSDPTMLMPGSILLGKYVVGKTMGKGGFGITYLAYDVTANRKVAIKEFFPYGVALRATGSSTVSVASMDNADAFKNGAEKFYSEAKLVSKFNGNPNIVGVYEFFYENDTVYFAMEYLKGHTLKEHIDKHGTLKPAQALYIAQGIANALMATHSSNVLHRDISPDNIIVCDNGEIKLIDFGAARQVVAEHSQSFSVILKPGFAPLEQYQKKGNQGPWTDIYSLGATIYYSLTEDIPEDPMSRLDNDEEYSSNMYNITPEMWSVISKATELKIEDRYNDIFELKNDLAKIPFAAEPLVVPQDGEEEKMPEFKTAMPFGMTQMGGQTAQQPVGAGAPVGYSQQPAAYSQQPAAYSQQPVAAYSQQPVAAYSQQTSPDEHVTYIPQQEGGGAFAVNKLSKKTKTAIIAASAAVVVIGVVLLIIFLSLKPQKVTNQIYQYRQARITYTGDWKNDMPNGKGRGAWPSGDVFEGEWKDGELGKGVYTWANRDVFEGMFDADGRVDGKGKYIWANGDVYEGDFVKGKREGEGTMRYINNDVYVGEYRDDQISGKGKYTWSTGEVYDGEWLNGARNGYGTNYYTDGSFYEGEWTNDKRNGYGKFTYKNGAIEEGRFINNKFYG